MRELEARAAAEIQQALLPPGRCDRATYQVAAASIPCRAIGGDFYDFFDLPEDAFRFVLADVAGKGPPAALLKASSRRG
jgi:phosphoserine phosphatase RsbU/P